jgi:general secretion pathway protein G
MEVLLVLAILGVIAAMVVPSLMGRQKQANIDATRLSINGIEGALKFYALDHLEEYPTSAQGLDVLVQSPGNDPKWKGPYLKAGSIPLDAWGSAFQYSFPGPNHPNGDLPDISSPGPDKTPNTDDDINNWTAVPR